MRRYCVPGLLALLAAAPNVARAGEEALDLFDGKGLGLKAEIRRIVVEAVGGEAPAVEVEDEIMDVDLDFDPGDDGDHGRRHNDGSSPGSCALC